MAFSKYRTDEKFSGIRKMVLRKRLFSVAKFLLLLAALLVFGYFWGGVSRYGSAAGTMLLCGCLSLFGLKLFGVTNIVTDRFFEGEIVKIQERTVDESKTALFQMMRFAKQSSEVEMYILKADGNVKSMSYRFSDVPPDYYKVGDRVRHYPGLYLMEKEDKAKDEKILCLVCRYYVIADTDTCPLCKHPLVK